MPKHEDVALRLAGFDASELSEEQRLAVKAHLLECPECRGMISFSRELASGLKSASAASKTAGEKSGVRESGTSETHASPDAVLLEHVHPQLLEEFTSHPDAMDFEVRRWVEGHLRSCAGCREDAEVVRELAMQELDELPIPAGRAASPLARFSRIFLRPAAALAYLVLLLVMVPLFAQRVLRDVSGDVPESGTGFSLTRSIKVEGSSTPRDGSGRGEAAGSGAETPLALPVDSAQEGVLLLLDVGLEDVPGAQAAAVEIAIETGGTKIWTQQRPVSELGRSDLLPVLVDPGRLEVDRNYEIIVYLHVTDPPLVVFRRSVALDTRP